MNVEFTFKSNSSKSNAKRFLVNTCKLEADTADYVTQADGLWGTYLDRDGKPVPFATVIASIEAKAAETCAPAAQQVEEEHAAPAPDAFSNFALSQLGKREETAQEPRKANSTASTGVKIEKNRASQNGVTRPSAGTVCADVWNLAQKMSDEQGSTVAFSVLVDAALKAGINQFTARTQYARWRAFHGITGRVTK